MKLALSAECFILAVESDKMHQVYGSNACLIKTRLPVASRIYYGWFIVPLAALAMLSTLPGRTHGLGLIAEPLLADLKLDGTALATINLWATLIGSAFCLPTGRWIDRFGSRPMLTLISLLLGLTVVAMSQAAGYWALFTFVLLSRMTGLTGYMIAMGISGGSITVLFFAAWTPLYGRAHVGRIQSAAQLATVFTSAVGPLLFAECKRLTGSYFPILHWLALAVLILALLAAIVTLPRRGRTPCGPRSAHAT